MATSQSFSVLTDEIADFLATGPSRRQLLNFRPSSELQDRLRQLLRKSKDGSITKFEQHELDQFEYAELLMRQIKVRLRKKATPA